MTEMDLIWLLSLLWLLGESMNEVLMPLMICTAGIAAAIAFALAALRR